MCALFAFTYICVLHFYDYGILFAADGIVSGDVLLLIITLAVAFLAGLASLHFIRLALSPLPSMIVDDKGISYKAIGVVGYNHVSWQGVRFGKRKGITKSLYMQILVPKKVRLGKKQNAIFKYAFWILNKLYQLLTFSFAKLARAKQETKTNFQTLRIYRLTIGTQLSKLEEIISKKIDAYDVRPSALLIRETSEHKPAVVRVDMGDFYKKAGHLATLTLIGFITVIPFSMIGIGSWSYASNLKNNSAIQQTQELRKLAVSGHADAQNKFGWRLSNGVGLPKSQSRAERWYLRAAKQGHAKAQYNVGLSYKCKRKKKSKSVCKNAVKWFRKSANSGFYLAQSKLAYHYYQGWGIKRSYVRAFELFNEAAKKGDGYAQYFVGFLYENGRGVERSKSRAVSYYKKAVKNGYPQAQKAIDRLSS